MPPVTATGIRATWESLPAAVRAGVEGLLGAPVVAAANQPGGFSPGLAARVRCADGDTLVHFDLRADNVLLDGARVWFVDWPWAFRGAAWIDSVMLLKNAALHGHDPQPYLDGHPLLAGVDPGHVTAFLAGMTGFFGDHGRRPVPPGLPTLREFQLAQHATTLAWVRRRTGWE